jgi:hypothetical protein
LFEKDGKDFIIRVKQGDRTIVRDEFGIAFFEDEGGDGVIE